MKKILLATIGLTMFATPLAAESVHSGYPNAEPRRTGEAAVSSFNNPAQVAPERFAATPSGMTQSFGLTAPGNRAGFGSSSSGLWANQDLRDRYGRISR